MSAPKTQRAGAEYYPDGTLDAVYTFMHATTPVLVVPETAVKKCKHGKLDKSDDIRICRDCGAWSWWWEDNRWAPGNGYWGRWQRPRILRVRRAK